jgi:hypothetical protein
VALASLPMTKPVSSAGSRCHFFLLLWSSPKARERWSNAPVTPQPHPPRAGAGIGLQAPGVAEKGAEGRVAWDRGATVVENE